MGHELRLGQWLLYEMMEGLVAPIFIMLWIGMIYFLREKGEGFAYNVSRASTLGDFATAVAVATFAHAVQRHGTVPGFFGSLTWNLIALTIATLIALTWFFGVYLRDQVPGLPADNYHNSVVVSTLSYFALISYVPIFFSWDLATPIEVGLAIVCLATHLGCFILIDLPQGRINQDKWNLLHQPWLVAIQTWQQLADKQATAKTAGLPPLWKQWLRRFKK